MYLKMLEKTSCRDWNAKIQNKMVQNYLLQVLFKIKSTFYVI